MNTFVSVFRLLFFKKHSELYRDSGVVLRKNRKKCLWAEMAVLPLSFGSLLLFGSMLSFGLCADLYADSVTVRLETVVTGNQEQPTVLFVMPWQPIPEPEQTMGLVSGELPSRLVRSYTPDAFERLVKRTPVKAVAKVSEATP